MDADFLIIGGGIAGVSAAARLAPHGKVVLVEAEPQLAHHASGRSAALYEPRYGLPAVVGLSMASGDYFRAQPGVLAPRGLMVLGRADQAEDFAAEIDKLGVERIPVEEARARVPILNPKVVAMAALAEHAWDIDTDLLLQGFARAARAGGAEFRLGARVTAITRTAEGWRVTAGGTEISAGRLVNAAGAWVDEVARMAGIAPLGFQPYRRSMARIPAPGGHDVSRWPMIFGCGETWYAKPDAGALIVSPAEEHPMAPHDAWADDMVLAEGLARYEEMVTEPVTRLITSWAGLRTFAPDRVLVIGPDAADPGFVWLAGQGGYGFQTSAAASQLVADLVLGHPPQLDPGLVAQLSPRRFS
ncbi:FAD-dependent oxidoreductase [bacterium]|nr:FAD-dependent oxidoreductase [bacterium]